MSQNQNQGLGGLTYKSTNDLSGTVSDVTNGNPIGTKYKNGVGLAVIADTAAVSVVVAGANAKILGVLEDNPVAGQACRVSSVRGISVKGLAGGTIAAGDSLQTDSSGRFITASGAAQIVCGKAMEAATVGLPFELVLLDSYVA